MINRMTTLEQPPTARDVPLLEQSTPARNEGWQERIERFVGDHAALALLTGAVIGVALGCLAKRR